MAYRPSKRLRWTNNKRNSKKQKTYTQKTNSKLQKHKITRFKPNLSIRFDNITNCKTQIEKIRKLVIVPIVYSNLFTRNGINPCQGILLSGSPCGLQVRVAQALASEIFLKFSTVSLYKLNCNDCLNKTFWEVREFLNQLFKKAKEHKPAIIFLDNIDVLAPDRSINQTHNHTSMLMCLFDDYIDGGQVTVIATTNNINKIDSSILRSGRLGSIIEF